MKKILTLIFLIGITQSLLSQNLSLNEIFALCNKTDWDLVNEYMLKKGWEYHQSSKGDDSHYNTITWSYNKDSYSDKAQGWFYLYTYESLPNKISYSFFNKQSFNTLKNGITSAGMKLIDNSIEDNEIVVKYSNPSFIVTLKTAKREKEESYYSDNSITAYSIVVIKKSGVYDNDNGLKKTFDSYGNIESEYTLKDGAINGLAKAFYTNGQEKVVSSFVNGKKQGSSKEYDEYGSLTAEYNYLNGEPTGVYKIYENNKLKIVGGFLNGEKNGAFKIYDSEGRIDKEYTMTLGLLNGSYTEYYYDEGKLFAKVIGSYSNGQKTGLWQTFKIKEKANELIEYKTYINDEKNGSFKEIHKDSILFGTYKNGALVGQYKVYQSLTSLILGGLNGDTTNCPLIILGNYSNGLKNGNWKYYSWTKDLIKEGQYYDDLQSGEWRYYFETTSDNQNNRLPYSGKLYLIENYENGKKNGKESRFAYLDKQETTCDTTNNSNVNPLDTCYKMVYQKIQQIVYYKNDNLHGPCEQKDSSEILEFKGNFVNGIKDGLWIQKFDFFGSNCYEKGYYKNGNRQGLWETYFKEGKNVGEDNYENGKLDGKCIELMNRNINEAFYENGYLKKITVYDSTQNNILWSYDITEENKDDFKCIYSYFGNEKTFQKEYRIKKNNQDLLTHKLFDVYYGLKFIGESDDNYSEGILKVFDQKNRILFEGYQYKKVRNGEWKFYYYDLNLYCVQVYKDEGEVFSEQYFEIKSNKLFSGKFVEKYENGNVKNEFKISEGLRNGKSKYFDEKGNLTLTEKYEKGILEVKQN